MSIMYQLHKSIGKKPCPPGSRVERCPMVVNSNSEDLLVSDVFLLLRYLLSDIWLAPLLQTAFKGRSFKGFGQDKAKVEFWKRFPAPPTTETSEGIDEIDIFIRIRHLLILIECKYRSLVQTGSPRRDQIARYLDAAIFNYWPDSDTKREILFILLTDDEVEPEILSRYRSPETVLACLTQVRPFIDYEQVSEMLARNVGWTTWGNLLRILENQDPKGLLPVESMIIADLIVFLRHKLQETKQTRHCKKGGDRHP
jgi:hypothetical protein